MTAFTVPALPQIPEQLNLAPPALPPVPPAGRQPAPTGRRAGDLALGIAQVRADLATQAVDGEATPLQSLLARHHQELAGAELRQRQAAVELTRGREQHLRAANWLAWQVADGHWRVLALRLAEALDRQYGGEAVQDEVAELRAALAHSRAYVSALEGLELPEVQTERPAPIDTDPQAWLALVEGHPRVIQARQAMELAAHSAPAADNEVFRTAWRAARRSVTRELRVRLTRLRELVRHMTHSGEAARWAGTLAGRQALGQVRTLAVAEAQHRALCAQAEWQLQASAATEALLDLRAFLGGSPTSP